MTEQSPPQPVSPFKKWIICARPWALPASTMPVIFGTSLAVVFGGASLNLLHFFLAFFAMVILHSAANMRSDISDFKKGLDTQITPVSGALVRGWLDVRQVRVGSGLLFVLGSALGLVLVLKVGITLFIIGTVGVLIGLFYSFLKYRAFGDLAVFLNFGILGALGAWVVQTGTFSWLPVIWTIPQSMLVSAILHANNWRDIPTDSKKDVRTMAGLLGDRRSLIYYGFLTFGPFAVLLILIFLPRILSLGLPALPFTFLLTLAGLIKAVDLWGRARRRRNPRHPMDFIILDGATANYNLIFGLLCIAAVWLHKVLPWI
jgi:1,4-dihydroxy-2-naphthoate octaprenyltransferase